MRWLLGAVVAVVAAGCGADQKAADKTVRAELAKGKTTCAEGVNCEAERRFRKCTSVSRDFRACSTFLASDKRSVIYRRTGERWRRVVGAPPHELGWWRRVLPSPDRRALLGQWSGACEIQLTYIVNPVDRTVRPILDGLPSTALGWSADGRARVRLVSDGWARKAKRILKAGVYRVNPMNMASALEQRVPTRPGC